MEMDDELADFIREHKAKVAEDKASLEQDPPYMEIKAKPHRTYGSTVKENIPPKPFAQAKEESYNVGLPLGMEYERKKQRLRHELRMDYRQYVAQKNQSGESGPLIHNDNRRSMKKHLLEDQTGLFPSQWTPSLRDAATLTEDNKGFHRDLILTEAARLSPEEEGHSSLPLKRRDRLNKVSEDEDLGMTEGRYTRVDTSCEKRQPSKINGEKKENPVDVARAGRRLRTQINKEDRVFATGLIIGAADTVDALRRRKEHYRKELQAQIAEQYKNKKREKELELEFAATEANDPEKQPHRSRQFNRRKNHQVLQLLAENDSSSSSSSSRAVHNNDNIRVEDREMPPPEHPNVAFQSPLLEYSSALGLAGGGSGLFPNRYPAVLNFSQSDTPRLPSFPPHPPSAVGEGFRSSNPDSHHYFGARHLIDPNMAYYGQMSFPAGLPISYWNVPPGGAVASHVDQRSQNSGSDFPEPQKQPNRESVTMDSHVGVFHLERTRSTRNRILGYRESLKQQIQEQQERKRLEREESERYEAQLEADMKNHHPWGRGGGGAPLRDSTGNLIADLSQMHKLNKEAYSNPEQWQRRAKVPVIASRAEHSDHTERVSGTVPDGSVHDRNDTVNGFTHVYAPQFARSNVFANQPTQQQLQEQDKYKAYLKEQIEEKMRKKAAERERIRLEEEKEEKRLAEQRARIQREYEEEQEKKKRKEMEQKAKNEELIQLAEQRKKEAERRKKEEEEKESAALRRQYERERQARLEEVHREPSPPIPTLQKKHGLHRRTPRPPTVDSHHSTVPMSESPVSGLQSPPVPGCRNQLRAAGDQRDVVSELSTLRRQLCIEQNQLEGRLQQDNWEVSDSPMSDRHRERPAVDVFDMARLRLQAPVRRPSSRNVEPRNLLRIHDSLHLKYAGAPKLEDVASKKWWDYRDLHNHVSSQRSTVQDDYFDLSLPHQHDDLRSVNVGYPRGSLLESESAFIDPLGDAFPVLHTSYPEKAPQLSARERRRLARQSLHPQEQAASSKCTGYHEITFTNTGNRLQVEPRGEGRSQDRPGHQRALSHCDNTAGPVDLSGDESSPSRFFLHNHNRPISQAKVPTDAWIYPGTSETLTCSDHQSRMTT